VTCLHRFKAEPPVRSSWGGTGTPCSSRAGIVARRTALRQARPWFPPKKAAQPSSLFPSPRIFGFDRGTTFGSVATSHLAIGFISRRRIEDHAALHLAIGFVSRRRIEDHAVLHLAIGFVSRRRIEDHAALHLAIGFVSRRRIEDHAALHLAIGFVSRRRHRGPRGVTSCHRLRFAPQACGVDRTARGGTRRSSRPADRLCRATWSVVDRIVKGRGLAPRRMDPLSSST
jgi:hypothetical protein